MSDIQPHEIVIDDDNYEQFLPENMPQFGFGLVPRDYSRIPVGSIEGIKKFDIPLIPRNEWSSRIRDMEQGGSRLSDLFNNSGQVNLDQGTEGFCWAYSPASAIMVARARDNQPNVRLSAHAVGCMIKNFRNQGGWNPQAVEFGRDRGYPTIEFWPEKSMSRQWNNAETWEDAAKYKITEGWMDLEPSIYDRNLSFDQLMTCLLSRIPCPTDHAFMSHSVCSCDPVEFDNSLPLSDINRWGTRFLNSWNNWGDRGFGLLRGRKAAPDGATAVKVTG